MQLALFHFCCFFIAKATKMQQIPLHFRCLFVVISLLFFCDAHVFYLIHHAGHNIIGTCGMSRAYLFVLQLWFLVAATRAARGGLGSLRKKTRPHWSCPINRESEHGMNLGILALASTLAHRNSSLTLMIDTLCKHIGTCHGHSSLTLIIDTHHCHSVQARHVTIMFCESPRSDWGTSCRFDASALTIASPLPGRKMTMKSQAGASLSRSLSRSLPWSGLRSTERRRNQCLDGYLVTACIASACPSVRRRLCLLRCRKSHDVPLSTKPSARAARAKGLQASNKATTKQQSTPPILSRYRTPDSQRRIRQTHMSVQLQRLVLVNCPHQVSIMPIMMKWRWHDIQLNYFFVEELTVRKFV